MFMTCIMFFVLLLNVYSGDPNKRAVPNKRAEWKNIVKLINVQA